MDKVQSILSHWRHPLWPFKGWNMEKNHFQLKRVRSFHIICSEWLWRRLLSFRCRCLKFSASTSKQRKAGNNLLCLECEWHSWPTCAPDHNFWTCSPVILCRTEIWRISPFHHWARTDPKTSVGFWVLPKKIGKWLQMERASLKLLKSQGTVSWMNKNVHKIDGGLIRLQRNSGNNYCNAYLPIIPFSDTKKICLSVYNQESISKAWH